jgi:diguanylate cyclase
MNKPVIDPDQLIEQLLADPSHHGHPLHDALQRLHQRSRDQIDRLERITRISDGFQSLARARHATLSERYEQELRRLLRIVRISDRYQAMLRETNALLEKASTHDPLTGVGNRRLLMDHLNKQSARALRTGQTYVLIIADADRFKHVNDTWGHEVGDSILIEICTAMGAILRQDDVFGRWGGEEFLVLLPDTRLADARPAIERLHRAMQMEVAHNGEPIAVTVSLGVTEHRAGERYSQTLSRADSALRAAKNNGRNQCVFIDTAA